MRARVVAPVLPAVTGQDMVLGAALAAGRLGARTSRRVARTLAPAARLAVDPPLVPRALRLRPRLDAWGRLWQTERHGIVSTAVAAGAAATQRTVDVVLPQVDLTPVVEAVLGRLDLDAVVTAVLARLDLDAVAASALAGLDLDPVAQSALADLDLAAVVGTALEEVDVTAIVVQQVALGRVVTAALDQIDLTEVVLSRVDLERVVTAALDTLDLTALVQQRVDIAGLAEDVVDEIDLPEIIRASTGGIAAEGIRTVRMHSVGADEAVSRLADKWLLRIRRRNVETDVALEIEQPPEVEVAKDADPDDPAGHHDAPGPHPGSPPSPPGDRA